MIHLVRRVSALAVALVACVLASGCGGASGGGTWAKITFENDPGSVQSIVQADFDFSDVSLLGNRVETVDVAPGDSVTFDFDQMHGQNLVDVTLTWSDATTTEINLLPIVILGGGDYTYPVTH